MLTGGFAFQTWWKGPNAGQFVVTLGGYHPSFHHDGYPTVPRLGLSWKVSDNISIVGESYFALCSEALMAGTSMEVSAHFGPAHASLSYGADGIVFFDPFWFRVSAWAEVRAGSDAVEDIRGDVTARDEQRGGFGRAGGAGKAGGWIDQAADGFR